MGIAIVVLFVLVMVGIGYISMRRTKGVGDFFLGGRSIGPWMSAFAYGTTYFSAVLFIGYGGKLGWGYGLHSLWIVLGNALIGSLLAWWVLGKRTRDMTSRLNCMTMPSFLAERYNTPALKVVAACLVFVFLVPYSAGVYKGLSYLFQVVLNMPESAVTWLLAGLTGVYLVMGGYFAVTLTDFIMGLMMVVGVVAMVQTLTGRMGGIIQSTSLLTDCETCSPLMSATLPGGIPGWLLLASLVVLTSVGPWGLPQMVQKFYSIKSSAQVKRAMIVATLFAFVIAFGAYYTGALTHINVPTEAGVAAPTGAEAYTPGSELTVATGPDGKPIIGGNGKPVVDWDKWMPTYLSQRLPGWIMMMIVLLVLSASMSTLSSLVLVSSSAIAMDLYAGVVKPDVEKKSVLVMMRVLCAVFVAVSLWLGVKSPSQIIPLMAISWGVLAGAFAAPYLYGLFWRRANAGGATAGMISGVATVVILTWILGEPGITANDPAIPVAGAIGMLVPFLVVPIFTLLTKPTPKDVVARAFGDGEAASK